jgi:hypothetical protein
MPIRYDAMHMSSTRNYEVQRTNHFEVVFENLSEDITLAVSSFNRPTASTSATSLSYGNTDVKVAGKTSVSDASLVVKDFILPDVEKQCQAWRDQVYDVESGKIGWAADYKHNGRVYEYAPDGTCERVYRIVGCWPLSYSKSDHSYEGSDGSEITMSISVDQCYPER